MGHLPTPAFHLLGREANGVRRTGALQVKELSELIRIIYDADRLALRRSAPSTRVLDTQLDGGDEFG
ncbi:hypothetical protein DC522_04855 [Microvirga sp. KLBC 81]|nr:hypothetical protein DC522_04855 [Microvirga sp. KLBC 81]